MASGGRLLKVRKTDPRYQEEDEALMAGTIPRYPHRKPSKKSKDVYAAVELVGGSEVARSILSNPTAQLVAGTAAATQAPRAVRAVVRSVPKLIKAATGARLTLGAIGSGAAARGLGYSAATEVALGAGGAALVAAAGLASYFTTRYIIDHYPTKQRRLNAAADAYRRSRLDLAAELGRALTASELKALADHFKAVKRDIESSLF